MALKDLIRENRHRVFMNQGQFASQHTWNGTPFVCVTDEETAAKRNMNNPAYMGWDSNSRSMMVFVPEEDFPGRAVPNEHGWFDNMDMIILQVTKDQGMMSLTMTANVPRSAGDDIDEDL